MSVWMLQIQWESVVDVWHDAVSQAALTSSSMLNTVCVSLTTRNTHMLTLSTCHEWVSTHKSAWLVSNESDQSNNKVVLC